ncbi:unnamed protein product [Polarella glacialis]|uniref:Uncharacterized protein n=1 Tax=Polarella glacialis TaxID=89957 RepID=A0A813F4U7_POLGL|nr:unnamed protein product [Polarella glacialis]
MRPGPDERRELRGAKTDHSRSSGASGSDERGSVSAGSVGSFYGSVISDAASDPGKWLQSVARWLETSEDTDPARYLTWCCDDFKPRRIKAPIVLAWLLLQAFGLVFQLVLLGEVSRNLEAFEITLSSFCGAEHRQHGVCLGPAWNLSYTGTLTFPPSGGQGDFDFVIPRTLPFAFTTASQPPTFLLGVEPQPPHADAAWQVDITPLGKPPLAAVRGWGHKFQVITGHQSEGPSWRGSVRMDSKYSETAQVHLYVVDSRIQHLEDVHSQKQCSFEASWQNFSERSQGQHHRVLSLTKAATAFFLAVQIFLAGLVLRRFYFSVDSGKLLSRVIILKFLMQDFPQQMCIAAYIYSWYSANGLRCQMCLFHPSHCDDEHPLHPTNLLVCIFTLLSAASNQLLLQAKLKRNYDSEDECVLCFFRFIMLSVSILPFTTALFFLSAFMFHLRSVICYILIGLPTILGWGTVLCVPLFSICDDDF